MPVISFHGSKAGISSLLIVLIISVCSTGYVIKENKLAQYNRWKRELSICNAEIERNNRLAIEGVEIEKIGVY